MKLFAVTWVFVGWGSTERFPFNATQELAPSLPHFYVTRNAPSSKKSFVTIYCERFPPPEISTIKRSASDTFVSASRISSTPHLLYYHGKTSEKRPVSREYPGLGDRDRNCIASVRALSYQSRSSPALQRAYSGQKSLNERKSSQPRPLRIRVRPICRMPACSRGLIYERVALYDPIGGTAGEVLF